MINQDGGGETWLASLGLEGQLADYGVDLTTLCSPLGEYLYVSAAAETMLGWEPSSLIGQPADAFVHPDDVAAAQLARAAALRTPAAVVTTQRFRRQDGGYLWTESVQRQVPGPGRPTSALIASTRDIADRKRVERTMERLALTDPLTGIANRTVFVDRLTRALLRLERHHSVLAVVHLDLDRFKVINRSLGYKLGDQLLIQVAERVSRMIRPEDTLARMGGDEFVVLAEGLPAASEAIWLAERICADVCLPFDLDGEAVVCTASAGVATTTDHAHSAQALLGEADLALHRAKDMGRNRADVFDDELRTRAIGRLSTEQMLRGAIEDDRLVVHYQPIVDLSSGQVAGVEALVRIRGDGDLIMPGAFIEVAEDTGLLAAIDEWVLGQAVGQVASWPRDAGRAGWTGVAVNITGRHLSDPHFTRVLTDAVAARRVPTGALSIELTERTLMDVSSAALDSLRAIRSLGVRVGLDDFGTGYSSVRHLRQLPLDFVKIDPSFISELDRSDEDAAMVTAIIDLAHAVHLSVTAEGIETADQLRILTRLGCDRGQGFLFSPAGEPGAITELIRRQAFSPGGGPSGPDHRGGSDGVDDRLGDGGHL